MKIYMNKKTGRICLLTFVNSQTGVIELEYDNFIMKARVNLKNISVEKLLKKEFAKIGQF